MTRPAPQGAAQRPALSLRSTLLIGILLPVLVLVAVNTVSLYRQALRAADTAYDRTLLASAKSIGEQLEVAGAGEQAHLIAKVPYSALETFEADNRSQMFYKVSGFAGERVSGFAELPAWRGRLPDHGPYAALVDFYDDVFRGQPVRVAVLLQPVAGVHGQGMATIQVAETLELRETLARQILVNTLWRQALLVLVVTLVVVLVVQRATRPVRAISALLRERGENDLSPIATGAAPRELLPLIDATNQVMARLAHLLENQKRFVRDTAHQLRTPLAVLRTQLQSAQRGDVDPAQAMHEMSGTVERATLLANQMLSLAKVEQLRQQGDAPVSDWAAIARDVALDLAPLIAGNQIDFEIEIETAAAPVQAHEWALRELTRNLLHNAIVHSPGHGRLAMALVADARHAALTIADSGPGIAPALRQRLFQPFAAGEGGGSGLGLAICHEIVAALGGEIHLDNRMHLGRVVGLDATVRLAQADNTGA
ncbi:MAG TPA: sensor histidine kinase N-terminal domain-containing protein [Burkholderiaceae bacterium]|nr:sensor histidine kinase N-terminal domain-containing protein [Burkholderiaceae bacterium]